MKKIIALGLILAAGLLPFKSVSAADELELITPNGGEKYNVGQNIIIKWTDNFPSEDTYVSGTLYKLRGTTWDPADLGLHMETSYPIYFEENQRGNSVSWKIPFDVLPGNYAMELSLSYYSKYNSQYATLYSEKPFRIAMTTTTGTVPKLDSITPNPANPGTDVTVKGSSFGTNVGVYMSQLNVDYPTYPGGSFQPNIVKKTRNSITFNLDQYFLPGDYEVWVQNNVGRSLPLTLTVGNTPANIFPFITSVTPSIGSAGTPITIIGGNFDSKNDINYYSNEFVPYPISEDAGDDSISSDDQKLIPPMPTNGIIEDVKSPDGKTLSFVMPADATPGTYTITVSNEKGYSDEGYFTVMNTDPLAAHPSGTNVRATDGTIYFISYGQRTPYPSAAVFQSYKFNTWASVVPASVGDMTLPSAKYVPLGSSQEKDYILPYRNGTLVNDKGTVYIINGDQRIPFGSAKAFLDAGYSFSNVVSGDTSFMVTLMPINSNSDAHTGGTLVNDNGTYYLLSNGYRIGFSTLASLESWGFSAGEAVTANSADLKLTLSHTTTKRPPTQLNLQ